MFTWLRNLFAYKLPKGTTDHCLFMVDSGIIECTTCNARTAKASGLAPWCRMAMVISPEARPKRVDDFNAVEGIASNVMMATWPAVYAGDPRYAALDEVNADTKNLCTRVDLPLPAPRFKAKPAERRTAQVYDFVKPVDGAK